MSIQALRERAERNQINTCREVKAALIEVAELEAQLARLRNALRDLRGLVSAGLLKTACNVIDAALSPDEQPAESEGEK